MKHMLVTLVALFIASASYADYSRDYIDTVPVKYTQSADTAIAYRVFNGEAIIQNCCLSWA